MWHALRAELEYSRPWLLGALAIGAAVATLVTALSLLDHGPPKFAAAGLGAVFLIMAPMIVSFIVQALRNEERRSRLLLAGPLTPRQLAGVMVLLPAALFAIGVVAGGLVIAADALLRGAFRSASLHMAGFVGGQMLAYAQMALLAQEATAAHRQRRPRQAAAGWLGLVVAVLLLAALYLVLSLQLVTWIHLIVGHLLVALMAMAASVALYAGRSDFTQ
jgi:hypothetical protein